MQAVNQCQVQKRGIAYHLKYTAAIAKNHTQIVIANLQYNVKHLLSVFTTKLDYNM